MRAHKLKFRALREAGVHLMEIKAGASREDGAASVCFASGVCRRCQLHNILQKRCLPSAHAAELAASQQWAVECEQGIWRSWCCWRMYAQGPFQSDAAEAMILLMDAGQETATEMYRVL